MNDMKTTTVFGKLKTRIWALCLLVLMITFGNCLPAMAQSGFRITAIDVGQGNAYLINNNGVATLVDTGLENKYSAVSAELQAEGIKTIQNLVLTHPDADHIGAADLVIKNYKVNNIYTTAYESTSMEYREVIDAAKEMGVGTTYVTKGQKVNIGSGASCTVLSPEKNAFYNDSNSASVVLMVQHGNNRFLMMGDATAQIENKIESWASVKCNVLFVGHHGSNYSSGVKFLKDCGAKYSLISVGANNSYGHPSSTILNRLAAVGTSVLRTDINGTVHFISTGSNVNVSVQKGNTAVAATGTLTMNRSSLVLQPGNTFALKASGIKGKVKWTSSNKKVATVSTAGKVSALKNGSTTITAQVGKKKVTCRVTVKKLTLNKYSASLYVGKKMTLTCSSNSVKWKSSNAKIATVSKSGVVTAKKAGTVTIKGTAGKTSVSCKIKVTKAQGSTTGSSISSEQYVCNENTGVFHKPNCSSVKRMSPSNKKYTNESRQKLIEDGYTPCHNCNP